MASQQDQFWASPTVRSVLMAIITGLLGALVWFAQWFAAHFDARMSRVEDDIRATKVVVITLAVKGGVDVGQLSQGPVSLPTNDHTPETTEPQILYVPPKTLFTLEDLLSR